VYGGEKSLGPAGVNTGPHERRSVEVTGPATLAVIRLGGPAVSTDKYTRTRKNK
jgi:hypothetical protein